jgi:hypothetical protein
VGLALLAITAGTGFADLAPTQYLPAQGPFWSRINHLMPTWLAEQYTLMSAMTLIGIVYILYEFGFVFRNASLATAGDVPLPVASAPSPSSFPDKGKTAGKTASKTTKTGTSAPSSRTGGQKKRKR